MMVARHGILRDILDCAINGLIASTVSIGLHIGP